MSDTITERQSKEKTKLLEQLKKMPIIQVACERASVSRATYYRWLDDDSVFRDAAMAALADGEDFVSDKSEAQLLALIGDKHFGAVKHWLQHHRPKYGKSGQGGRPDQKIRVILLHDHED